MRDDAFRLRETDWEGVATRRVYAACREAARVSVSGPGQTAESERVSIPAGCNRGRMLVEEVSGSSSLDCDVQALWCTPGERNSATIAAPIGATADVVGGVTTTDPGVYRFGPGVGNSMFARVERGAGSGVLRVVWWFWREGSP
jgi:hypothetical protein